MNKVPLITDNQPDITFNISVRKPGSYVVLVNYVTPLTDLRTHDIQVTTKSKQGDENGHLKLYSCPYTTMCRQIVTNEELGVAVYDVDSNYITIKLHVSNYKKSFFNIF